MAEISLEVAQARLDSGEDYIDFELESDIINDVTTIAKVRILASIFTVNINKVYTFVSDGDENDLAEDIAIHISQILEQSWNNEGVDLSQVGL